MQEELIILQKKRLSINSNFNELFVDVILNHVVY